MREAHIAALPLELLACPVCYGALELAGGEAIHCRNCARLYPIRDGIPVLIASEAVLPEPAGSAQHDTPERLNGGQN